MSANTSLVRTEVALIPAAPGTFLVSYNPGAPNDPSRAAIVAWKVEADDHRAERAIPITAVIDIKPRQTFEILFPDGHVEGVKNDGTIGWWSSLEAWKEHHRQKLAAKREGE